MSKLEDIINILPEGLSESTVEEICKLVGSVIEEQVDTKVNELSGKVNAFLRTKVEDLKEQALAELHEENEMFRNARIFESIKSLMALEINEEDQNRAVQEVSESHAELQEEFDVLVEQCNLLIEDKENLENTVRVLSGKLGKMEQIVESVSEEKTLLEEQVENLEASREEAFTSSEQAVVIGQQLNESSEREEKRIHNLTNEFLTEEVMKYMPFKENN
jgi:chromosome segregation ATPase